MYETQGRPGRKVWDFVFFSYLTRRKDIVGKKGCGCNALCPHFASGFKCRTKVRNGECNPSQAERAKLGLPFSEDVKGFHELLKRNGGRIPVAGW